ncbi:MAG: LLM class F420-dependent oxidoreductase [Nitrospinota bacterium]
MGVSLPVRGPLANRESLRELAREAEGAGLDSLWVSDHVVIPQRAESPYPYSPDRRWGVGADCLAPIPSLAFLAGATERVRLGTSVLILPYRPAILAAKQLATLDFLSGGRLILGVGAGWLREEFEALGLGTFAVRGEVTDETIRAFRALWREEAPTFQGRYVRLGGDFAFAPKPLSRPFLPIWVGGHSEAALRRAGRLGDGWHPIGMRPPAVIEPAQYAVMAREVAAYAEEAGRDPNRVLLTFRVPIALGVGRTGPFTGSPEQVAEDVGEYARLGVRHFVFDLAAGAMSAMREAIGHIGRELKPLAGG